MSRIRFIAGSGRSGTTWVLDAIAKANGLRPVFEPLNPWASEIGSRYAHRALRPGESHPELKSFLADVFDGRRARLWTQYRRHWNWLIPGRDNLQDAGRARRFVRRVVRFAIESPELAMMSARGEPIVKCIWANLMLDWLVAEFGCRVVLVVRHPGAVIESEVRGGWDAAGTLEQFRRDPGFHAATGGRYARLLERPLGDVEALALRWLIENQPHLDAGSRDAVMVANFENLAARERASWEPVCRHLEVPSLPDEELLGQPSQQSSTREARSADEMAGASWRDALGPERCARIQGVLDEAGFVLYRMSDARPHPVEVLAPARNGTDR